LGKITEMTRNSKIGAGLLGCLAFGIIGPAPASADTILFDRGLPTTNLNNAAGANRSNVAWGEQAAGEVSPATASIGDTFSLSAPSTINTIQVWVVDNGSAGIPSANSYQLWLGPDATPGASSTASVSQVSATAVVTQVTYADGSSYQNQSGTFSNIYQVDFTGLDLQEAAGNYAFSVSGLSETSPNAMLTPFLSASNGPLSGTTEMDDLGYLYAFSSTGQMETVNGYPYGSIGAWDKSSDINIEVFGTVPEPASLFIFGAGLAALGAARRRKRVR
jgi:hypothetical protein